jgi:hypothetical protein
VTVLDLKLRYCPHPGQRLFHESDARFRCVAPGRRWGKTFCGANETIRVATSSPPDSVGYVIAPSYSSSSLGRCWQALLMFAPKELIKEVHRTPGDRYIRWVGNRFTKFRSAEAPESCKGDAVHYAWFDEPAEMGGEIWDVSVLPSLMDTDGRAWFTGTPKGSNWYRMLFMRGQDQQTYPEYWSHGGSSYENTVEYGGYLKKESIDFIASQMSERSRQQEIMGIFLDDYGVVFRKVDSLVQGSFEKYDDKKRYVVGADLAKHADYTVIIVLDEEGHVCFFDRFDAVDWNLQESRIANVSKQYGQARVLIDSTGLGDPVFDALRKMGCNVEGYRFTNASKADLVENLMLMMENGKITYPPIPVLQNELKLYGYNKTPGGTSIYGAPEGQHDDAVTALMLAAWMLGKPKGRVSFV